MLDAAAIQNAELMDRIYRHQRLIYDLTRKYFLFGRDRLIDALQPREGSHVLEIACGTGRNLRIAARKYPYSAFYGLDISSEMLNSAQSALGERAQLALADATDFDGYRLFRRRQFDRIFISYGLSMIPDWEGALRMAAGQLAPGGQLHVVDFSDQSDLPDSFARGLNRWLAKFHVTPRERLAATMRQVARETGGKARHEHLYGRYAQYGVIEKRRI